MALWFIEPAAAPEDGRWQGREIWRLLVVQAPTPADARLAAEHWALGGEGRPEMENENINAGFADEKLYWVRQAPEDLAADVAGESSRVLSASRLS